jgi:hypothetical protein
MKAVIIPQKTLDIFIEVAKNNCDVNGKVVETLAFLIGTIDGEIIKGTEILFPNQYGDASRVSDNGKTIL